MNSVQHNRETDFRAYGHGFEMKPVGMIACFSPGIFSCTADIHKRWKIESLLLWKLKKNATI